MKEKNLLILCIIYFSKNIFLNHFWVQGLVCLLVDLASKIRSFKKNYLFRISDLFDSFKTQASRAKS